MTTKTTPEKLIVKRRGRMFVLNVEEIVCLKSQNNYTKIMLADDADLSCSRCLKQMIKELDNRFHRVSQSYAVNMNYINEVIWEEKCLILSNNEKVKFTISINEMMKLIKAHME